MRILHVLDHSLPLQSGYVSRTLGIIEAQRARGWEPVVLTTPRQNRGKAAFDDIAGWRFYRTPTNGSAWPPPLNYVGEMRATAKRLSQLIDETKPDVVHAHSPLLNGIPALWAARPKNIPVLYEVRALWEEAGVEAGTVRPGSLRYHASRSLETYLLRRADAVAVLCDGVRKDVLSRGIHPKRICTIPNAVNLERFSTDRHRDRRLSEQLGLGGGPILGYVGSFYEYEGLDLILEAFPRHCPRFPA